MSVVIAHRPKYCEPWEGLVMLFMVNLQGSCAGLLDNLALGVYSFQEKWTFLSHYDFIFLYTSHLWKLHVHILCHLESEMFRHFFCYILNIVIPCLILKNDVIFFSKSPSLLNLQCFYLPSLPHCCFIAYILTWFFFPSLLFSLKNLNIYNGNNGFNAPVH